MKDFCYYISPIQDPHLYGGYVPSFVERDQPGHSPMTGSMPGQAPWVWGKTLKEAEQVCKEVNARMGVNEVEAAMIVGSSMSFKKQRGH